MSFGDHCAGIGGIASHLRSNCSRIDASANAALSPGRRSRCSRKSHLEYHRGVTLQSLIANLITTLASQ